MFWGNKLLGGCPGNCAERGQGVRRMLGERLGGKRALECSDLHVRLQVSTGMLRLHTG